MDDALWPYKIQDGAAKQALMVRESTNTIPLHKWTGNTHQLPH